MYVAICFCMQVGEKKYQIQKNYQLSISPELKVQKIKRKTYENPYFMPLKRNKSFVFIFLFAKEFERLALISL